MKSNKKLAITLVGFLIMLSFAINIFQVQAAYNFSNTYTIHSHSGAWGSKRHYKLTVTVSVSWRSEVQPTDYYISAVSLRLFTTTSGWFPPSLKWFALDYMSPELNGYWRVYYPSNYDNSNRIITSSSSVATDSFSGISSYPDYTTLSYYYYRDSSNPPVWPHEAQGGGWISFNSINMQFTSG